VIDVDCHPPTTTSTHGAIDGAGVCEHRLRVLLDELGLTGCFTAADDDGQLTVLSIVDPGDVGCNREVDSFASESSVMRHQVGHRLWERIVGQSDHIAGFWLAFGGTNSSALEQWAEAFDTYMLILDIAGTASERGLLVLDEPYDPVALPFAAIFDHALPYLSSRANWVCDAGTDKNLRVTASKLAFVHGRVSAHSERVRFYSLD